MQDPINREPIHIRQSLYSSQGLLDLCCTDDALVGIGKTLRAHTGMKSTVVLLFDNTVPKTDFTELERSIISAGFKLVMLDAKALLANTSSTEASRPEGSNRPEEANWQAYTDRPEETEAPAPNDARPTSIKLFSDNDLRSLKAFQLTVDFLVHNDITTSDALIAAGTHDVLNLAACVSGSYQHTITTLLVPTTYDALITSAAYPASLASAGLPGAVQFQPAISAIETTPSLLKMSSEQNDILFACALMVKAAFIDSAAAWKKLLSSVDEIAAHAEKPFLESAATAAKSLAFVRHVHTIQVRSTFHYADLFTKAFCAIEPAYTKAEALAEALRFSAHMGNVENNMPIEFAIEQAAALETLGLPAPESRTALQNRAEDFVNEVVQRSRRYARALQCVIPLAPGRLSATLIDEETLLEAVETFCQSRL